MQIDDEENFLSDSGLSDDSLFATGGEGGAWADDAHWDEKWVEDWDKDDWGEGEHEEDDPEEEISSDLPDDFDDI